MLLNQEEKVFIAKHLLTFNLIKFDPSGNLPLKSGGTTDIYINLRDARSNTVALNFVSNWYSKMINRTMRINKPYVQFIEVPHSVSCFAPLISVETLLPYLTIKVKEKHKLR